MPRFLYVEARDVSMPGDDAPLVSFEAVSIVSEDEDEAYALGAREILVQRARIGDISGHGAGAFLNDCVFNIGA